MVKRALAWERSGVESDLQTLQTESWSFSLSTQPSYGTGRRQPLTALPVPFLKYTFALEGRDEKTSLMMERGKTKQNRNQKRKVRGLNGDWRKGAYTLAYFIIRASSLPESLGVTSSSLATGTPVSPHPHTPQDTRNVGHSSFPKPSRAWSKCTHTKSQWNPAPNANQLLAIIKFIFIHASKVPKESIKEKKKKRTTKVVEERTEKESLETRAEINVITSCPGHKFRRGNQIFLCMCIKTNQSIELAKNHYVLNWVS